MTKAPAIDERLPAESVAFLHRVVARVRAQRQAAGMSQAKVAGAIEMSRMNYNNIECGRQNISITALADLATLFGCSITKFLDMPDPNCYLCGGHGEYYGHSADCYNDRCALAGGLYDCQGEVFPCDCHLAVPA